MSDSRTRAASCFWECALNSEASIRITMVVPRSRSATGEGGIRPCRWAIGDHSSKIAVTTQG